MWRIDLAFQRLALPAALGALGFSAMASASDQPPCLLESLDSLPALSGQLLDRPPAVFLLDPGPPAAAAELAFECTGTRLAVLALKLRPGMTHSLTLVVDTELATLLASNLRQLGSDFEDAPWQVSIQHLTFTETEEEHFQLLKLYVTADPSLRPGQRHEMRLLGADADRQAGDESTLSLVLESLADEPMFRDNFQIDPTVSQFSLRSRPVDPAVKESSGLAGSASL